MPIQLDDKRLVKRVLKGDERAFEQFFNDNFSRLYRFAAARMNDDPEATREIVQSALSKGLKNLGGYRGEAALFTWLCTICRNEMTDWSRRDRRYRQHIVLTEDSAEIQAAVDSLAAAETDDPRRRYQKFESARLVQVALDRLPPRYGDALEWKYIEGHTVREIAQRLGVSHDAAQSLLARARRAFEDIYTSLARPVFDTRAAGS